jgi:hypothetical protein
MERLLVIPVGLHHTMIYSKGFLNIPPLQDFRPKFCINFPWLQYEQHTSPNSFSLRTALFWVITQRNYHYSLRNNPEERSAHLLHGGSLKLFSLTWQP